MEDQLQAIATLFLLVNPAMCAAIFAGLEKGRSSAHKTKDATKAILAIGVTLILAALLGSHILRIFGVSIDAFTVVGGIVLAWIGFSMLRGKGESSTPEAETETALA
jgi:multiple antibiotic resistance protein